MTPFYAIANLAIKAGTTLLGLSKGGVGFCWWRLFEPAQEEQKH
jgi:hypothetical protein